MEAPLLAPGGVEPWRKKKVGGKQEQEEEGGDRA